MQVFQMENQMAHIKFFIIRKVRRTTLEELLKEQGNLKTETTRRPGSLLPTLLLH